MQNNLLPKEPKFKAIIKKHGEVIMTTAIVASLSVAIADMQEEMDNIKYADNNERVIIDTKVQGEDYRRSLWSSIEPGAILLRVMHVRDDSKRKNKEHLAIGKVVMV